MNDYGTTPPPKQAVSNTECLLVVLNGLLFGLCGLALLVMCFTDFTFIQSVKAVLGTVFVIAACCGLFGLFGRVPLGVLIGIFLGSRL